MERVVIMYKTRGETPLEALGRLRKERNGELPDDVPLTYAGRLDPLAEGVLPVLIGEEAKRKEHYLGMEKEYRAEVLFGFSTDTYDVLGKLTGAATKTNHPRVAMKPLLSAVSELPGTREEPYPPYSSKTLSGTPLHTLSREGTLSESNIPVHTVTVFESALLGMRTERIEKLWQDINEAIASVSGDFRQKEIRDCWWEHVRPLYGETVDIATLHFRVASGAYVRALAERLGKTLGIPALALTITRTRVGPYTLSEAGRGRAR